MLPFTLQQLKILKTVAKEKNFTKASELLYLSQPSLSKQIKILEKNLGILLFNRENNKVFLTENGQIFLEYCDRILALCEESCRTLLDLKNGERGNLIIGTTQSIGSYLMPRILTLFIQNYPQIGLKVLINSTQIMTKNVLSQEIDIAIVDDKIPNEVQRNLTIENFLEDDFSLIISKFHPLAKKKEITKDDLYHLNFITLSSNCSIKIFIENILMQNQIEIQQLKIIMQLNSLEKIKIAVSLGLGAAFISSSAVSKEVECQTLETLIIKNIRISRTISIISNPNSYKSKWFEEFSKELDQLKKTIEI
jgi:DNA-binding transcriptional LysR family regulator